MKSIKLISLLLAILTFVGAFTIVVGAEAEKPEGEEAAPVYTMNTGNGKSLMMSEKDSSGAVKYFYKEGKAADGTVISTPEQKIAVMDLRYETETYRLYVDAYSGEVAVYSKETGEYLFTNPYNIGQSKANGDDGSIKDELLSQVVVNYFENSKNDPTPTQFYSYTWAAVRNQIKVRNIKGGIRVEYTLGREENRSLLPHLIEASKMEKMFAILEENMEAAIAAGGISKPEDERHRLTQFKAYYERYSLDDAENEETRAKWLELYPIFKTKPEIAVYAINEAGLGEVVIKKLESLIKEYYTEYTYEMLDEDHKEVEYEAEIENYPLFKLALEYTIDETSGLVVRLPANSIRFDETLYRLDSVNILPYMGAGMNPNTGYTFFPDGSGTLFAFEDIKTAEIVSSKLYGPDYAYHKLSGMYEEVVRYPVFGIYENQKLQRQVDDGNGGTVTEDYNKGRGFVAIIEEGDSLMELTTSHGGIKHEYNTMIMSAKPRPTDSYNIADTISVGKNTEWTVVSARKYTGSFTVRYIMLTDKSNAENRNVKKFYETSYVGMAKAYREYLERNGMLKRLSVPEDGEGEDIPLYIETFGALQTTERILSIPVKVMTPLTTFDNIKTMYEDLKNNEITNVNFILTGFTKGGLTGERVPYKLKWEKSVSKEMKFEELNDYARANGFGVFPDFDFVFASGDGAFDGLRLGKHAAKTIDNRYTSKREYSATKHTYVSYYELALSSAYFSHFYEKFIPQFRAYNPVGISVSSLGSYLNSDFDEDEPYNRADSKMYTIKAFDFLYHRLPNTEILTSGGNSYCWKFVDHITDVSLDSSRFAASSASVPFLGMVLHGYVDIAGTPVNMEGNLDYAFLKAVESGASLKFILSYQNTKELKEYETLSKYYSVDYAIWFDQGKGDLVAMYKELNSILKGVRYSLITGHEFIDGVRVPDSNEIKLDAEQAIKDAIEYEIALENAASDAERNAIYEARQLIVKGSEAIKNSMDPALTDNLLNKIEALKSIYNGTSGEYAALLEEANNALITYQIYQQSHAIHTDIIGSSVTYKVDTAINAYDAYTEADPSAANYAELKDAYDRAVAIVGQEYLEACLAERDAKKAYEAASEDKKAELEAAYAEATKKREALAAGVGVDLAEITEAMEKLEPYKQAWIEASKGTDTAATDAAKKEFDEKVREFYGDILADVYYQINYNGVEVGGSRWWREEAKRNYTKATEALDAKLQELYDESRALFAEVELFTDRYNLTEIEKALAFLNEKDAYTADEREALAAIIADLKAFIDTKGIANDFAALVEYDINAMALKAYDEYLKHYAASDAAGVEIKLGDIVDYELSGHKASTYLKQTQYTWTEKYTEPEPVVITKPVPNTDRYKSDANMIVHETFDNGTEFILNFNDYSVVVVLNGVQYSIEAFGYVVLNAKA
ncbi:MAG: hypothetical protein E7607_00090 [Ruminococcaceae bacterium]|nr:hypothetical protein [Oscillospiraceae bacterium]